MTVLYVTSDQKGAGKTAFCTTLVHRLIRQGRRAAVLKPLGRSDDPDLGAYEQLLGQTENLRPRRVPKGGLTPELLDDVEAAADDAMGRQDIIVVEGTSDMSTRDSKAVAEALNAKVVVIARFHPGLGTTHLSRLHTLFGDRLLGFVINGATRYQGRDITSRLLPAMESQGLVSLGAIPEDRTLLGVSVGQIVSHLEGRYLIGEELPDGLVEYFVVGGLGMDSGLEYFGIRDNKAVIVRGDRPDIQMAALQTPTACMLLTRDIEPIEYVINEAELEEVPIVVVRSDTLSTMDALKTVHERARFDQTAKLVRYSELLDEHLDIDAIHAGLGLAA